MLHSANWNEVANGDVVLPNHYMSSVLTNEGLGTQCMNTHFLHVRLRQESSYAWKEVGGKQPTLPSLVRGQKAWA
jgi:hypothetical protein